MSEGGQREMPRYRCHKEVWALKILAIRRDGGKSGSGTMIVPEERGYAPFEVDVNYVIKHNPQPGGYYVVYKDGYESFSPADAFEEGYTMLDQYGHINERRKPTIAELEAILKEPDEPRVEILPDGSIRSVPSPPPEAMQGNTP